MSTSLTIPFGGDRTDECVANKMVDVTLIPAVIPSGQTGAPARLGRLME
jgi:hypothetical protein